jgi:signal peptidase I
MMQNKETRTGMYWQQAKNAILLVATTAAVGVAISVTSLGIGFTPVLSPSMSPAFETGEIVITRPESKTSLGVGDVTVLPLPNKSGDRYLHRIVEVQRKNGQVLVRTKGDSNTSPDPWTLQIDSQNVPVAIAAIPHLGSISSIFQKPNVRLLLGLTIAVLSILGIFRALREILHTTRTRHYSTPMPYGEQTATSSDSHIP